MSDPFSAESFAGILSGTETNPVKLPVLSGSMSPVLIPGDTVIIAPCTWKECRRGDIIVFRTGLSLTAHRLILIFRLPGRIIFYHKGDGMNNGGLIAAASVRGRCIARIRGGEETRLDDRKENAVQAAASGRKIFIPELKVIIKWILKKTRFSRWKRAR